jgi:iron(III) transport system ATP-binding protein
MVFQSYALYPHMTVRQNLAFGLENLRTPATEIESRVQAAAKMLRLDTLLERRPTQLSGGQRQRVAIGRAIVREPAIFLFDEPLSNLDAELRVAMRNEISALHRRLATTMIYVTHDQVEAMTMADRIVVMNAGRIEQIGTPEDVFDRPHSRFVARFIGGSNLLEGAHVDGRRVDVAGHALDVGHGEFAGRGKPMSVCVKTHDMHIDADGHAEGTNVLPGVVRSQAYLGSHRDYIVDVGQPLLIAAPATLNIPAGSNVTVRFRPDRCRGIIR